MVWAVPDADAVTLGEIGGELYSVTPRDQHHIGDEFVRRGGTVFPPARVTGLKQRRPFGQEESLTRENDDEDGAFSNDPRAVQLGKKAVRYVREFFVEDEEKIVRSLMESTSAMAKSLYIRAMGEDHEDASAFISKQANRIQREESIASIAWHPTQALLAVAQRDGVVTFFDVAKGAWDGRVLEHYAQQEITSIAWANYSGGILAVACRGGVFLWKLWPNSKRQDPELLHVMTHPAKRTFTQVCWSEDGALLAAFTEHTDSVFIFDTHFQRRAELKCQQTVKSIHWSPTGEYLFVATMSSVSILWETLTWKKEVWELATGCSSWSQNGKCLLVAPRSMPIMYPYEFRSAPPSISVCMNSPPIDFAEKDVLSLDRSVTELVGGTIESLTWDPTSTRVAITYQPTSSTNGESVGPLVAIFSVVWSPYLIFTRSGLIRGPPNTGVPRNVAFASSFEKGALLSIAWSCALISFHPFYFDEE